MAKIRECKLTTFDNEFSPFDDFDKWLMYDIEKGYDCCGRLDRLLEVEDDMSSVEVEMAIEKAIDRIIDLDILNIYKKEVRELDMPE